jgi:hypothetical protein
MNIRNFVFTAMAVLVPFTPAWSGTPVAPAVDSVQIATQSFGTDVVFHDEFEDGIGLSQKYVDYNSASGACDISTLAAFGGSSKSVRAKWTQGQVDAGSFSYFFGRNPSASQTASTKDFREIYWRFYVKTSKGWTGNPAKLTRATVIASKNWAQAMIAHLWGEGDLLLELDPATGIDSSNNLVTTTYNDFTHLKWLGLRKGTTSVYDSSRSNSWQCIEAHVKLNTPGSSDGVFEFWVDGNLEARRADLNWMGTWQSYGINAIMFENYWNSGATKAEDRYIDNIVISTKPIGLAVSPVNPSIYKSAFEDSTTGDTQSAFYAQVSTAQDDSHIVWSGGVSGLGNTVQVNKTYGSFQGVLANRSSLQNGTVYYARARQADNNGNISAWSGWKKFMIEEGETTPPAPPIGVKGTYIP